MIYSSNLSLLNLTMVLVRSSLRAWHSHVELTDVHAMRSVLGRKTDIFDGLKIYIFDNRNTSALLNLIGN